ncbi:hypothetical protein GCM10018965_095300 [Nonomuraea roseola]
MLRTACGLAVSSVVLGRLGAPEGPGGGLGGLGVPEGLGGGLGRIRVPEGLSGGPLSDSACGRGVSSVVLVRLGAPERRGAGLLPHSVHGRALSSAAGGRWGVVAGPTGGSWSQDVTGGSC